MAPKKTTQTHVPPPAQEFKQEKELREERLIVATVILSGMYSNPCHGNRWYASLFDWFKSLFGLKGNVASSIASYRQLSSHAIKAADELMYQNETTPIQWSNKQIN